MTSPAHLRGFTLIEVVVAFAVFALSATVLYGVFGDATRRAGTARIREANWLVAQSLLDEVRTSPTPWDAERRGRVESGQTYRITISPLEVGNTGPAPWHAWWVRVEVEGASGSGTVALESVELARGPS
jgi:general secretion pathway protein I